MVGPGRIAPDLREDLARGFPPEHRGHLEQPPGVLGEPVDPRQEHLLDRVRRGARRADLLLLGGVPRQLLEEERVALGLREDAPGDGVGRFLRRQEGGDHAEALLDRERLQRDLGHVRPVRPGRPVAGAIGEDEQQGHARQALDGGAERLGRRVDPVQVLDGDDERARPAAVRAHPAEDLEGPALYRVGADHVQLVGFPLHPEELE